SPLGWSSDSKYVLLRDDWDIWQVPVSGKENALNLTRNGRTEKIRYQYRFILDREEKGIDLSKVNYIRTYGENNKKSDKADLAPAKKDGLAPGAKVLLWRDVMISGLGKAEKAEVYTYTKENSNEPTQVYLADATFADAKKVTENAP